MVFLSSHILVQPYINNKEKQQVLQVVVNVDQYLIIYIDDSLQRAELDAVLDKPYAYYEWKP